MNAVNLLPAGAARGRGAGLSVSRPFLGLVATLGVALVATILYVSAHDTVNSRRAELHRLQAATASWTTAAAAYDPAVEASSVRAKTIATVRTLSDERYDWSTLLTQIGWRLPAHAELSSLEATAPTTTAAPSSSDTTSTPGVPSTTDGIQIAACATSQDVVAATMTALRRVAGVSQVTLSSSSRSAASSTVGGASCSLPIQFTVTLSFTSSAAGTSSTAPGSTVGTEAADTESGQ